MAFWQPLPGMWTSHLQIEAGHLSVGYEGWCTQEKIGPMLLHPSYRRPVCHPDIGPASSELSG